MTDPRTQKGTRMSDLVHYPRQSHIQQHYYDQLTQPALWIRAVDDQISPQINVEDILTVYENLKVTRKIIEPAQHGLGHLGHMRFFSKHGLPFWPEIVNWIVEHS